MEQPADRNLSCQIVVDLHGLPGFEDLHRYATLAQVGQGGRVDVQLLVHALGQHDHGSAVGEQFLDVGRLDPGLVAGAGFAPVPLASATGLQLDVLTDAEAGDFHASPGDAHDRRDTAGSSSTCPPTNPVQRRRPCSHVADRSRRPVLTRTPGRVAAG